MMKMPGMILMKKTRKRRLKSLRRNRLKRRKRDSESLHPRPKM
jgi:hypothetical protein